jgi:CheY-like chemotaxis protein
LALTPRAACAAERVPRRGVEGFELNIQPQGANLPPDQAPGRPLPRRPVVLVVEDEVLIAWDLAHRLARHGWRVRGPAATVAQALRLLGEGEPPDVALLDVNLRGELVTPVAEALRARGVPFVLASAYDPVDQVAPALAGVPNVGKPLFNEARLLAALAQAIAR